MSKSSIVPCLWFDDQAELAAQFYTQTLPHGRITAASHYPQSLDNPSGKPRGGVLTVEFEVAGQRFTALNGGPHFVINPSISFFVQVDSVDEANRIFTALTDNGQILMPIDSYPWSPRYGWVQDRFHTSWQVMTAPNSTASATIMPCLMFAGPVHRQAESAIQHYTQIFPDAHVNTLERYAVGEGPEGTIKHGRFTIDGQEMVAMDSHIDHQFRFNEGVSLQVMCKDQQEVDYFWTSLSKGGSPSRCGWLKDRFGVSWQIVPETIAEWMSSNDTAAKDRAFKTMLTMDKLDIARLQAAFRGA